MMTGGGYQPDPIAEHAAVTELVDAVGRWRQAEQQAAQLAAIHLEHPGIRADVIAGALGMSRATMYRWVSQKRDTAKHQPTARKPRAGQGPAQPVPKGRRRRP